MKVWLEVYSEDGDETVQCCKCRVWQKPPKHIFYEFQLLGGAMPNPNELHPEPTGTYMCLLCWKMMMI